MRVGLMIVGAMVTMWLGGWAIAELELLGRISDTAVEARGLCTSQRGHAAVTTDTLIGQFNAIAEDHGVDPSDVSVETESHSGGGAMGGALSNMTHGKLRVTTTELTVLAHVHSEKWMWSIDRDIKASCVMHGGVQRVGP